MNVEGKKTKEEIAKRNCGYGNWEGVYKAMEEYAGQLVAVSDCKGKGVTKRYILTNSSNKRLKTKAMSSQDKAKQVTEKQLLDAIDKYKKQLADSKTISPTKFDAMQLALYGCKCIIWDAFGSPRRQEMAWSK